MNPSLQDITNLFLQKGMFMYGQESVSQLEHALQCATLAEANHESSEMITACLLHDLGHLMHNTAANEINNQHEYCAIPYLHHLFSQKVTEPIRLHVDAKRYLCFADQNYWVTLSPASKKSLKLQGGIFSAQEAIDFISQPYAQEAIQLRHWDDQAKVVGKATPDLTHFTQIMATCTL